MQKYRVVVLNIFILGAFLLIGPALAHPADVQEILSDPATHWINQGGSTMSLVFDCDGTQPAVCSLSGSYVNHESGFLCQGTPYPLTGVYYINTQTISWSVAWSNGHEDCASVTGWTGYITFPSGSPPQIVTYWNLAYSTGGSGRAILQGKDTFTQNPTVQSGTLLKDPTRQ